MPTAQTMAELEAAKADPINARILQALAIWGEAIPLETMREITAETGKSLPTLRARQKRLVGLLTRAGTPPEPLFDVGELVCLRNNESVVGVVASLTGRTAQIRLAPDARSWLSVRFHEIRRVKPRQPRPVDFDGLTRGQRAIRAHRRRQAQLRGAKSTTTTNR